MEYGFANAVANVTLKDGKVVAVCSSFAEPGELCIHLLLHESSSLLTPITYVLAAIPPPSPSISLEAITKAESILQLYLQPTLQIEASNG